MKLTALLLMSIGASAVSGCRVNVSTSSPPSSTNDRTGAVIQDFNAPQQPRLMKLPSGKTVTVLKIATLTFAPGGDPPALHLTYRTKIPINNISSLKRESNEIWKAFQKQVDKDKKTIAVITAEEATPSFADGDRRTYTFSWKKNRSGIWIATP